MLLSCLSLAHAEPLRVTVVLSESGGAYQTFSEALLGKLPSDRFALNTRLAGDALSDSELYVAVGMKAASALAARDISTLNVFVPKTGYDSLRGDHAQRPSDSANGSLRSSGESIGLPLAGTLLAQPADCGRRGDAGTPAPEGSASPCRARTSADSAIYLDQPMERQLALLRAALPDTRHVGILYSVPTPELQNIRHLLGNKEIRLHDRAVDEKTTLNDALAQVLNESEVLFVLPDPGVYNPNTIRNILLAAYRKQIPMIGISQAYVKAGALCAVFSTPEQIAVQAASMIGRYAESGNLPAAQYPSEFEVSVNVQVARSLGLHIKDADRLRDEIRGTR